jgi:hypothetical protein
MSISSTILEGTLEIQRMIKLGSIKSRAEARHPAALRASKHWPGQLGHAPAVMRLAIVTLRPGLSVNGFPYCCHWN